MTISFVMRVHNEEASLAKSIESLFALQIPVEVIVVLHRCTDRTADIAREMAHRAPAQHIVKVATYEVQTSRPGLETYLTPTDDRHSIMTYYNYAFGLASNRWKFKWDADFIATPGFLKYMHERSWVENPTAIYLHHQSGKECYALNSLIKYVKHTHWETPLFETGTAIDCAPEWAAFQHSAQGAIKSYWRQPSWFQTEDSREAISIRDRYNKAVEILGPEPFGCARSNTSKECLNYLSRVNKFITMAP